MRYNAFYGELPLEAFKPIGGRMRLYGGGDPISAVSNAVTDAVSGVVSGVGDVVSGAVNTAGDVVSGLASGVGNILDQVGSNPLTAAALLAAGYYFAPEIGAWIGSDGTALAGTETGGVAAGTTPTTVSALTPTGTLGTGTLATPGDLGTSFVTQGALDTTPTVGQLTSGGLSAPAVAGTGAAASGLLGGATTGGELIPATLGNAAGSAAVGNAVGNAAGGSTLGSMLPYMAAGQTVGGLLQANAAQKAANIQSAAAQGATQLQGQIFNTLNQQQAPYRTGGYQALNQIGALGTGPYVQYDASGQPIGTGTGTGYLTKQFSPEDFAQGIDPGYAFRLQQGQMANLRAANVGGGALSGNTLKGLQDYTQGLASTEYGNAFNRFQTQRTNIYNTLAGIAGLGQVAQGQTGQAAQTYGTNVANLGVGAAGAQAAGLTGAANAYGNLASNLTNTYLLSSLLGQGGSIA